MSQPIDTITWLEPFELKANDYNPNVVFNAELRLLELSIVKHGWLHPILVHKNTMEIIDGFHRWTIAQDSKKLQAAHGTKVPFSWTESHLPTPENEPLPLCSTGRTSDRA